MSGLRRVLPALVIVAAVLAVWQSYVTAADVRPQVLPSPLRAAVPAYSRLRFRRSCFPLARA